METTIEGIKKDVWRISDFTKKLLDDMAVMFPGEKVSYHFNTIDGWFKELEKRGIHYVERSSGEKLYDSLDLDIAKFIFLRRREKFALDMTFDMLTKHVEIRPFPPDGEVVELPKSINEMIKKIKSDVRNELKNEIKEEIRQELQQDFELKLKNEWKKVLIEERKLLDNPELAKKKEQELQERIANLQIQAAEELETEAVNDWNKLDESVRMIRPGLFAKKIENASAKADFIREYKNKNMKKRVQELINKQ